MSVSKVRGVIGKVCEGRVLKAVGDDTTDAKMGSYLKRASVLRSERKVGVR